MKNYSDLNQKVRHLQNEINELKHSQVLGGDNTRVYQYSLTGYSPILRKKGDVYIRQSDYDDPDFYPVPGGGYWVTSLVYPKIDDPFALVEVERIEIRRSGRLLSWSNYRYDNYLFGQKSQFGDSFIMEYMKSGSGWGSWSAPRLGTTVRLEVCAPSNLSDNPGDTIQYTYNIWLRSTSVSDYGFLDDYTGAN